MSFPDVDNLMADIFDEIDEDLKRDQIQILWARYGKIVMAVVAAIVECKAEEAALASAQQLAK